MDNMPEIESVEETYAAKPFDVFMQELEERYERSEAWRVLEAK